MSIPLVAHVSREGAYVVLFIEHMQIMYGKRTRRWAFGYLVGTSISLFLVISTVSFKQISTPTRLFGKLLKCCAIPACYLGYHPDDASIYGKYVNSQCTYIILQLRSGQGLTGICISRCFNTDLRCVSRASCLPSEN